MASFAYIKELFEKKDKNGNGYLDLLVIGSDKRNILPRFGSLTTTVSLKKTTLWKSNTHLTITGAKTSLQSHLLKKRQAI